MSAYAPTRDARGAVVDGVALEVSTADVAATQDGIPHRTIHAFVVARLLVVPVGLVAAQVATSSITRRTDAAVQVAEGGTTTPTSAPTGRAASATRPAFSPASWTT
jgi:hypothetical protein